MRLTVSLLFLFLASCSSKPSRKSNNPIVTVQPTIESKSDTIRNGEQYKSKVFLKFEPEISRDQVPDYITGQITYFDSVVVNNDAVPTPKQKEAKYRGDTSIVEFFVQYDNLKPDSIIQHRWDITVLVGFPATTGTAGDTTYFSQETIWIKG